MQVLLRLQLYYNDTLTEFSTKYDLRRLHARDIGSRTSNFVDVTRIDAYARENK